MGDKKQQAAQRRAKRTQQREVARRQAKLHQRATRPAPAPADVGGRSSAYTRQLVRDLGDAYPPSAARDHIHTHTHELARDEPDALPYLAYGEVERELGRAQWRQDMPGYTTQAEVAALADEALLAGLASRGLRLTRDAVVAQIDARPPESSAWTMSRELWLPAAHPGLARTDRYFVGQAAVELWKRWRPDAPPLERTLDDYLDAAFAAEDQVQALLVFMRALRERLSRPGGSPVVLGGERLPTSWWCYWLFHCADALAAEGSDRELLLAVIAELDRWNELRGLDPDDAVDRRADAFGDVATLCEKLEMFDEAERRLRAGLAIHSHSDGELDLRLADLLERDPTVPDRVAEARALREAAEGW